MDFSLVDDNIDIPRHGFKHLYVVWVGIMETTKCGCSKKVHPIISTQLTVNIKSTYKHECTFEPILGPAEKGTNATQIQYGHKRVKPLNSEPTGSREIHLFENSVKKQRSVRYVLLRLYEKGFEMQVLSCQRILTSAKKDTLDSYTSCDLQNYSIKVEVTLD